MKIKTLKRLSETLMSFFFLISVSSTAQIRLPALISDGMILQRDTNVKLWGWASDNEKVTVYFRGNSFSTRASENGKWQINLPSMKAGGPYTMILKGKNEIRIDNILLGDIWVCSGQSNMELPVRRVSWIYEQIVANCENPEIRQFKVPQTYSFKERLQDYDSGKWEAVDPNSIMSFSAVGYFFAGDLYEKYKVPVGLINTAIGGSPAEAWMSEEALKEFPQYYTEMQKFKSDSLIKAIEKNDRERASQWYGTLDQKDQGYQTNGKNWSDPDVDISGWPSIEVPGYWTNKELSNFDGSVWYRKSFMVEPEFAGKAAKLILGRIVDADSAFLNGKYVGSVSYQYPPRRYDIPEGILKEGRNTIVVRVINNKGAGGFVPDKPYYVVIGAHKIDLSGEWKYHIGAIMKPMDEQTFVRWKPGGLFNAMIAPLLRYRVKGILWYQGESNADRPVEYRKLFPAMICDWRKNFKQEELPFLYVQLPNYMEAKDEPSESNWAMLREAQLKALSIPNTGMVVAIDVGEWNDIHPLNKKTVGERLSVAARKVAYGEADVVGSGPVYKSMKVRGNKITLSFSDKGKGLTAKGSKKLKGFAVAGEDRRFVWAKAKIKDGQVIVSGKKVLNPVAVRYGWADNPENANLYNKEGLPASPFRTDDW